MDSDGLLLDRHRRRSMNHVTMSMVGRAVRSLRRSPGFVAIAAVSLGTALGLSTAVFAMMDAMTHPASAFRQVDQLFMVTIRQHSRLGPSRTEVETALRGIGGVDRVATFRSEYTDLETAEGVDRRQIFYSRTGFFELLGARPQLGRLPTPGEAGAGQIAVVSDGIWRRGFGNRRSIEGATITIHDQQYRVVAVLPNVATFPGTQPPDVWVPDPTGDGDDARIPTDRPMSIAAMGMPVIRIRGGLADTLATQARLQAILQRWTRVYAQPNEPPFSGRLESLRPDPLELKDFHRAMVGAAVCVLLIACANVAALMLARGMVRRRDYALRLALGAGRGEIAREVVVEVAVLAAVGCVLGAMVATWVVGLITRTMPAEMHWMGFVQPQWSYRVLALGALAVLVSISLAGGIPAWQASRTDPMGPLKDSGGGTTGRAGTRFRWLVMAQLALSMTLIVGASLLVKSTTRMANYDFGYDARGLLHAGVAFSWRDSTSVTDRDRIVRESLDRVRALPEVRGAAAEFPCSADHRMITSDLTLPGGENAHINGECTGVGAEFFHTLGMPLLAGRDFEPGDAMSDGAVILGDRAAKRLFPHEQAIGRTLKLGPLEANLPWLWVVGIVRNQSLWFNPFPETGPDTTPLVYALLPHPVAARSTSNGLVIRPRAYARNPASAVLRTLRPTVPPRAWVSVQSWQRAFDDQLRTERFLSLVFALLGGASLALGAAGLFSVVSYVAGQRMREFAVRMALGATRDNVLRLVLREGLVMALGGTAVGAGLGMRAGFLLWDKMSGVYPVDAGALVAGEAILLGVTMLACLVPAVRATRANPVEVLRSA
jgi:predicted permease